MTKEEFEAILADCECPPYHFRVEYIGATTSCYLQVRKLRPDTITQEEGWGGGSKVLLSQHMVPEEVRQQALKLCLEFAEHEVREAFKWKGKRIFGPHIKHDALAESYRVSVRKEPEGK